MKKIVFDSFTGRILRIYNFSRPQIVSCEAGELVMNAESSVKLLQHYVDLENAAIHARSEFSEAFDKAQINATGEDYASLVVPPYSFVTWPDGEVTQVDDGLIEFATDLQGIHTFKIDSVEHFKKELTIEAVT